MQFQTNINWYRCFSLHNMSSQRGDWSWMTCHFSVLIHCELCYVLGKSLKPFICRLHLSISKEHSIWSCTGIEAFWQSGGKELLKVLLTLDMACLIGDISPTSDVTKVAGFCNSLLMISSTSSEKQSETDLPIVRISTPLLQWKNGSNSTFSLCAKRVTCGVCLINLQAEIQCRPFQVQWRKIH